MENGGEDENNWSDEVSSSYHQKWFSDQGYFRKDIFPDSLHSSHGNQPLYFGFFKILKKMSFSFSILEGNFNIP